MVINMKKIYKWGILGPGDIAHKFAEGLEILDNAELYAVVSRSIERAESFGEKHHIEKRYSNYKDFCNDKDIDIVYIATPHPMHKEYSIMCMEAGKSVLCEKPVAMNECELAEMINCAKKNNVFFMEAMWTRFLPSIVKLRELLKNDKIGTIKRVTADFAYNATEKKGRIYEPELGGGALLDVGVYVLSFATMILGYEPKKTNSLAYIGETGVDERTSIIMEYSNGVSANLFCGISINTIDDAYLYGEKGYIRIPSFWHAEKIIVKLYDESEEEIIDLPMLSNGYNYEAQEVMQCIDDSKSESKIMPHEESLKVMRIMDGLRKQWGLKYPME
jgi:dihydrodiol dehydrogenase / D-xylose 1-dehydrogenase (NADP)